MADYNLKAKHLMTPTDIMVSEKMPVSYLVTLLREMRLGGLPVCNSERKIIGFVSVTDVFKSIGMIRSMFHKNPIWIPKFLEGKKAVRIKDIYHKEIVSVGPDTSIEDVAVLMLENDIHTIPVMDDKKNKLLGVVGRHDITWAIFKMDEEDIRAGAYKKVHVSKYSEADIVADKKLRENSEGSES